MAFVIDIVVDIEAPAERVWQVITDFPRYAEWNTFVVACRSTLRPGDPIDMLVQLGGSRPRRQHEWVRTHTPGREFGYGMKPVVLGALRSHRSHTVTTLSPDRTAYASHFELAGWLQPMVTAVFGRNLRHGFAAMTAGIKEQAEHSATG